MRAVLISLCVLALGACASPRPADVRLPAAYEAAPTDGGAAFDRWWSAFDDPELTRLIEQGLAANVDVRAAWARLAEARATRLGALAQLLPQGDARGAGRRTETRRLSGTEVNIPGFSTTGVSEAYSANFDVSWEVDLFGRLLAGARAANADMAAARFAYEAARAALAAQMADAYFQARGLAIQLADARETERIRRRLYEIAVARAERGLAATSEPDRVAGDLAQAQAQAASLEAELQVQKRMLLVLAGRASDATAAISAPASAGTPPPPPFAAPSELLRRRPDVREAEARLKVAAGLQDVAARAFFPTFTLTPGVGWSRTVQPGFSSTTRNWTLGGTVSQPVLAIPRLLADLKAQNARTEQAVVAYEKAVQTAFQEAEAALVRLEADQAGVERLTDGEARAARAYEASRIGYARGLIDLSTALSSEQAWRASRAQLTAAQVQALRRTVQAYKALGGGWSEASPAPPPQRPRT